MKPAKAALTSAALIAATLGITNPAHATSSHRGSNAT